MSRIEPNSGIFKMFDFDEFDVPVDGPAFGDIGCWIYKDWNELNPYQGQFYFDALDDQIDDILDRGFNAVAISIMLFAAVGDDTTPTWVYLKNQELTQGKGHPILPAGTQFFPGWGWWDWNVAYHAMVQAFGAKYDTDDRVHSVWICTGEAGEAIFTNLGTNPYNPQSHCKNSIDWYNEAFPNKPLFFLLGSTDERRIYCRYCAERNVYTKHNVLGHDLNNHVQDPPWLDPENGTAQIAFYSTQTLGNWHAYEHGAPNPSPGGMYQAMLTAIAHGARLTDWSNDRTPGSGTHYLDTIAAIDTDALQGDFWAWCVEMMGFPLRHVAMWVARDTIIDYDEENYQGGWDGPWVRAGIEVNATAYSSLTPTYATMPAALEDTIQSYAGIGYCSAGTLIATLSDMPDGEYDTMVIYSEGTAGSAGWQASTSTVTVADGAGTLVSVAGPCWVHMVTATLPGEVSEQTAPIVKYPKTDMISFNAEVASLTPTLSWTFTDVNSGDAQSAYQVVVLDSQAEANVPMLDGKWNSGTVASSAGSVVYDGDALTWGDTYYWRVRVWDDSYSPLVSNWCSVQSFTILPEAAGTITAGDPVRDHFRLGTGRILEWISPVQNDNGTTMPDSGYRATVPADPDDDGMALITSITVTEDATELVTRVYPQSAEGLTVELATSTPPTGYTVDTDEGYVEHDAGVATYGAIEQWKRFSDVSMTQDNSLIVLPELCANALVDRAVEYLRVRAQVNTYYNLEVICNGTLKVGTTIKVVYRGYSNDGTWLTIDDDLYITSVTTTIDEDGFRTTGLEVSTIDAERGDDASILARAIQATHRAPKVQRT